MLTDYQKSTARHDGGKAQVNRKRHLAQIKSVLFGLSYEVEQGAIAGFAASKQDIAALKSAARVVADIEAIYAKDATAAKQIKTAYDSAIKAASQALRALVRDDIGDVIALYAIANPRDDKTLADLLSAATDQERLWQWRLEDMKRNAVADLAYQIVQSGKPLTAYCEALDMAAEKAIHASLIAQIKAARVAQQIQKACA